MPVWSGLGVNYKAQQANWDADIAYFNSIGLRNIRPHMPGTPHPWNSSTNTTWRNCAQYFHNAGFWVTWGTSQSPITNNNWQAYHDSVVAEAQYLQQQGIVIDEFEIGNELEGAINKTVSTLAQSSGTATCTTTSNHGFVTGENVTINGASPSGYNGIFSVTVTGSKTFTYSVSSSLSTPATGSIYCYSLSLPQLNTNLRQLATDVKAVFNLGQVSYACFNSKVNGVFAYNDWIANGLGGLDTISIHPYGNIDTSSQTINDGGFVNVAEMIAAFGNKCYVSEFNLDATSANLDGFNTGASVASMQHFYSDYILKYLQPINSKALIYMWSGYLNQDNEFAMQLTTGSLIQPWGVFLNQGGHNPRAIATSRTSQSNRQGTISATASQLFRGNNVDMRITPGSTSIMQVGSSNSYTVGARVKLAVKNQGNDTDNHTIAACDFNFNTNLGYAFEISANSGKGTVWVGNVSYGSSTSLIQYGTWQSVIFRISGTTLNMFVQGINVWTATITRKNNANGSLNYFGTENTGTGSGMRRTLGNAREYFAVASALSDTQIQNIALYGIYPTVGILYKLDENGGSTAHDSSGNNNNGNITGANWSTDCNSVIRTNLATNPSFEAPNFFWGSGYSGTITGLTYSLQDTTHTLYGTYAAMVQCDVAGQYYLNSSSFTPVIGNIYTVSAYIYVPANSIVGEIAIGIRDYSSYNFVPQFEYDTTTMLWSNIVPGQWTRVSYTAMGGAGGYTSWRFTISDPRDSSGSTSSFTSPQSFWVDGTLIEASPTAGSYFDGSFSGASWTGTANNSTSIISAQRNNANSRILVT
jgi:hypothetical protein